MTTSVMGEAPVEEPHALGEPKPTQASTEAKAAEETAGSGDADQSEHADDGESARAEQEPLSTWSLSSAQARRGTSKAATLLSGIAGAVWMSNVGAVLGAYWR